MWKITSENYDGKLYVNLGRKYLPIQESVEYFENLEIENERLKQEYEQLKQKLDWFLTETVAGKEYRPKEELEELQRENAKLKATLDKMKKSRKL